MHYNIIFVTIHCVGWVMQIGFVLSTEIFVVVKFHRFVKVVCQGPLTFYEILSDRLLWTLTPRQIFLNNQLQT